jgi:hypothetical protein
MVFGLEDGASLFLTVNCASQVRAIRMPHAWKQPSRPRTRYFGQSFETKSKKVIRGVQRRLAHAIGVAFRVSLGSRGCHEVASQVHIKPPARFVSVLDGSDLYPFQADPLAYHNLKGQFDTGTITNTENLHVSKDKISQQDYL